MTRDRTRERGGIEPMSACQAGDSHGCCAPDALAVSEEPARCPACGRRGQTVGPATVRSLAAGKKKDLVGTGPYRFCTTPSCDVIYFDSGRGQVVRKGDVSVRVGLKETTDPITICYCFGHTRGSIRDEIARTGSSKVQERITALVKAGRCACETMNPSGRCCLGDVSKAVREIRADFARAPGSGPAREEGEWPRARR